MTKAHRLAIRRPKPPIKTLPLNFLLGCSQSSLENFELARLAEVGDLRKELHAILDRVIDAMSQAALASWFKEQDRQRLKDAIENEESPLEWAKRKIREGQRSGDELIPRTSLPPGAAHLAAALRYQDRNIAEGKCQDCPKPLDPNSVRYCTKHLAAQRMRHKPKDADPGSRDFLYQDHSPEKRHGRTPGTLASLAMNREKATRRVLAELGVRPEHAAVSLNAAVEALQKCMPRSQADALTQAELFERACIPSKKMGQKALSKLFSTGEIQRIGKGISGNLFRYWNKKSRGES